MPENAWSKFKGSPNPVAKIREIHDALQAVAGKGNVPGLNVLFREAREDGTVMGVRVLNLGTRIYVPRKPIVRAIEGVWWGPEQRIETKKEVTR